MRLEDTVNMMKSEDFKERFKAEYYQLRIRQNKLSNMLMDLAEGKLHFTPKCPKSLLMKQCAIMEDYITVLEARAAIEGVDLTLEEEKGN